MIAWRRLIPFLLAGCAVGAGAWALLREEPPAPVEVIAGRPQRARIEETVRAVGHVEPVTQVRVSSNITGDLLALHVREGEEVKHGQLLAEIDRERLLAVVRQNEANASSLEAAVRLEEAQLAEAKAQLGRTEGLHGQGLTTDAELDQGRVAVQVIEARMEAARQRVTQARAALDEAKAQLARSKIFAPIGGTVIALPKKVGERIRGSDLSEDLLLTIAPLHAMQVEVEVAERDVVKVREGQDTRITVDALGARVIPGKVTEIGSSAVIKNRGTEMETTSFPVKVALLEIPEHLRSGMSAAVAIVTQVRDEAIAVPIEAVTARLPSQLAARAGEERAKAEGGLLNLGTGQAIDTRLVARREKPVELVFVVEHGLAEARPIEAGISGELDLEVRAGLAGDEVLIVGPYEALAKTLRPGTPVRVAFTQAQEPASEVP